MAENRESNFGTVKPYGAAIREAVASGDSTRIRQAAEQGMRWLAANPGHESHGDVKAALGELDAAMSGTGGSRESNVGNNMPYGSAIREAVASGDKNRIRQAAEQGMRWLAANPGHENHGDVQAALRELDEAHGQG